MGFSLALDTARSTLFPLQDSARRPANRQAARGECKMTCPGCKAQNPDDKKGCGECGAALEKAAPIVVPGEDGAWFCAQRPEGCHARALRAL